MSASPGVVFLVQEVDALGGSERQALALAGALARGGAAVRLLSCTDRLSPRRWVGGMFPEDRGGVRIHRIPRVLFESSAGALLQRRRDWRVIYAVGFMMGTIAARLGRLLGAPVVVKLAGSGLQGDVTHLLSLPQHVRQAVQGDLAQATLVCVSDDMAREAREVGFPPEILVRISNGVDTRALACAPAVTPQPRAEHTILYAGRLDPYKGVETLIEAVQALTQGDDGALNVGLLVAGEGSESSALRRRVSALGLEDQVQFLGRRDDVPGLLNGATCCCLPSLSEGMSNVLMEAMAAGTPIVATDLAANRELLTGSGGEGSDVDLGDAGLLVPPRDSGALASALRRVCTDTDSRARLAAAGRRRAERFDIEAVAADHAALFARVVAGEARPSTLAWAARFARARATDVLRRLGQSRAT